jgi:hypothetical protein
MSARIPVLTQKELEGIAKVSGQCVKVDLSRTSCAQFDSLKKTLLLRAPRDLTGLGINFDLNNRTQEQVQTTVERRSETETSRSRVARGSFVLSQSILARRHHLSTEISSLVSRILNESRSITFLSLRSIDFQVRDFRILGNAVFHSESLRTVHFCNLPLGDANFEVICRALKRRYIFEFRCRKCGLTDGCAGSLHSLISYHVSLQGAVRWRDSLLEEVPSEIVCLQFLDLRDNDLTYVAIREIADSLIDLPLRLLDFRGNPGISATVVTRLAREMPDVRIRTGPSAGVKIPKKIRPFRKTKKPKGEKIKKRELRKDNRQLRTLVKQLEQGAPMVELEPDLAIVGPRAKELARHLLDLDRILQRSTSGLRSFFFDKPPQGAKTTRKRRG